MINDLPQSEAFESFLDDLLRRGNTVRFQARGASMSPAIRDGEMVYLKSALPGNLRRGDIVLVKGETRFRLHRLVVADAAHDVFITRGDCGQQCDPAVTGKEVVGIAVSKEVRIGNATRRAKFRGPTGSVLMSLASCQRGLRKLMRIAQPLSPSDPL